MWVAVEFGYSLLCFCIFSLFLVHVVLLLGRFKMSKAQFRKSPLCFGIFLSSIVPPFLLLWKEMKVNLWHFKT